MEALMAGLLAWSIEFLVALTGLCILAREEKKVVNRRKKAKTD
jgi:hypothetical protein